MTAQLVEKALTSSLGYLPEIQSIEEDQGLLVGVAHTPDGETLDEPGTHIGFVVDPANVAMLIRIGDNDANIIHPIGGPDTMTLRLAVNIVDEREWSRVRDGGGLQAMSLLFGGQPDRQSVLAWDDIRIDQTGRTALTELQARSRDRAATARLARELSDGYGWVPGNLREAIYQIAVAESDAPAPLDMGYEFVSLESLPYFHDVLPQARVAIHIAKRGDLKGSALLDAVVEGDMAIAKGGWHGSLPDVVSVGRNGKIYRVSPDALATHLPTEAPQPSP